MEAKQAVQVLKQVIDQSIQNGVFKNAESVIAAANALQVVIQELGLTNQDKQ